MKIEILGTGCSKCTALLEVTKKAVAQKGIFAQIDKVEDIMKIIDIELASLIERLTALNYHIELTEEAKNFIADKGFDKDYGARPLKRAIQKYIEDPMAEEIINAEISEGDHLILDLNDAKDGVKITVKGKTEEEKS